VRSRNCDCSPFKRSAQFQFVYVTLECANAGSLTSCASQLSLTAITLKTRSRRAMIGDISPTGLSDHYWPLRVKSNDCDENALVLALQDRNANA
jgi:hypothetical protein